MNSLCASYTVKQIHPSIQIPITDQSLFPSVPQRCTRRVFMLVALRGRKGPQFENFELQYLKIL